MKKAFLAAMAVALAVPGVVRAQDDTARRLRELERELQETESVMRELRRELDALRGDGPQMRFRTIGPVRPFISIFDNRARLGVTVRTGADDDTDAQGAVIEDVTEDGPAAEAGIQEGDIVTHFNDEPLVGRYPPADEGESEPAIKLIDLARELEDGESVELRYERDGRSATATVVARELNSFLSPGQTWNVAPRVEVLSPSRVRIEPNEFIQIFIRGRWNDLELVTLDEDLGAYFGATEGVLVVKAGENSALDLRSGDVILRIGEREPESPTDALRILRRYEAGETVTIEVMRQRERLILSGEIPEARFQERVVTPRADRWRRSSTGRAARAWRIISG